MRYDAVVFDLDGVVTDTAKVHARAWKTLFDEYLCARDGASFRPFDASYDYLTFVDGKPRSEGVDCFLRSRGVALPLGAHDDAPELETVWALGNRKDIIFLGELGRGVDVFAGTIALARQLSQMGVRVGVASSSRNCERVLRITGLEKDFEARVDGVVSQTLGLKGKPAPDIFVECARRLGSRPERAIVVEDAISGVQAGRSGGFALVVGIDRHGQREALLREGADVVVEGLEGVDARMLDAWITGRGQV